MRIFTLVMIQRLVIFQNGMVIYVSARMVGDPAGDPIKRFGVVSTTVYGVVSQLFLQRGAGHGTETSGVSTLRREGDIPSRITSVMM